MFALSILFSVLAVLAQRASASDARTRGYIPADGQPCSVNGEQGLLKGALCIAGDVDLTKRLLGDGLLRGDDRYHSDSRTPYGFGWFHPGAFREGDRCWQNDREGLIANALCIVAEIKIGDSNTQPFNGWFDRPYYGYGHRFGWYHPGPFLNGDRCLQDGWNGMVRDGLCVQVDATTGRGQDGGLLKGLSLGRRSLWGPDYWQEPRFSPGQSFGWFHDGPFANGDRCWSNGYYGTVTDSLCVLAKVDLNLKRDDGRLSLLSNVLSGGGRSSYKNGERCFKQDSWGKWWHNDCAITGHGINSEAPFQNGDRCWRAGEWGTWSDSDCILSLDIHIKRDAFAYPYLFRDDPRLGRGVPCTKDGQQGILRDTVCIIADVDIDLNKRDHQDDVADGVTWSFEGMPDQSDEGSYDPEYDESYDTEDYEEMRKRSPLLTYTPGDNRDHAVAKTIDSLVSDVKSRSILGNSNNGGVSHLDKLMGLGELKGLDQVGGTAQPVRGAYRPYGAKSDGLLGGLLNGGLLGKRDFGHISFEDAERRDIGGLGGIGGVAGMSGAHGEDGAVGNVLKGVLRGQ